MELWISSDAWAWSPRRGCYRQIRTHSNTSNESTCNLAYTKWSPIHKFPHLKYQFIVSHKVLNL